MSPRVAVIGTGFGASVQIPGFQRLEGVEVAALASGRFSRAQEVAARFGIPHAFEDVQAMLDAVEIDLVSVASPPHMHYPHVMEALRQRKHVICEKPFALSLGQAREMLQTAERTGVVHALDHEFRYLPARTTFTELVEQGYLGQPRMVRAVWRSDSRVSAEASAFDWWSERDRGGGVLGAIGSHYVDSFRWWFGEMLEVVAALDTYVPSRPFEDGSGWGQVTSDDTAALLLHLQGGVQATIHLSAAAATRGNRVEAYGSEGALVIEEDERLLGARGRERLAELPLTPPRFAARSGEARMVGPFAELAARVVARIQGQSGPDFPTFREGAAVQAVLDAARRSARERCWVQPEAV